MVLDPRVDQQGIGVDVYHSNLFHRAAEDRSLTKVALNKIASAAGASFTTTRTDPRTIPNYWEMRARLTYTDFDGSPRVIERTAEVDLRDGSPQVNGMKPGQISQARRFGLRLAEAKACNAAARDAWGIPSKLTTADLQKPFVALRVSFVPDMSDPIQRRLVAERALGGSAALYPQASRALPEPDVIDVEPERERDAESNPGPGRPRQAPPTGGQEATTASGTTVNTTTGEIVERQAPPEPTGPTIVSIRSQDGVTRDAVDAQGHVTRKGGRAFRRTWITLSDGRDLHTFDTKIGELAEKFKAEQAPIEVETQDSKWGVDVVELKRAEAQLPYDDDGPTDADLKL